jgi:hypothetical protein
LCVEGRDGDRDTVGTADDFAFLLAIAVAILCGALAGRVFAVEGENRRTSILAAGYCGAGAGLLSGTLVAFAVVLIAAMLDPAASLLSDLAGSGRVIGPALLWGTVSGAGAGLVVGIAVASFKRYAPRP